VIDLRKKLAIKEIVYLLNFAELFIGTASGPVHLAGCCHTKMVTWNYVNPDWYPKTANKQIWLYYFDSKVDRIINDIKEMLSLKLKK